MNSTLYVSADTTFDEDIFGQGNAVAQNIYITEPMPALKKPAYQLPDEEELHTSFEEAISDRLLALQRRLSCLSDPTLAIQGDERSTDAVPSTIVSIRNTATTQTPAPRTATDCLEIVPHLIWKRTTIFACSATMFLLLGFDLMGFLVLHIH
jgi:hypothetical protein